MLKDIIEMIFSLPNEDELKNMTPSERAELLHKFDEPETTSKE